MEIKEAIEICRGMLAYGDIPKCDRDALSHLITEAEAVEEMLAEARYIGVDGGIWRRNDNPEQWYTYKEEDAHYPSALAAFKSLKESK